MNKDRIKEEYYKLLGNICNIRDPEKEQSFMLLDSQAWQWGIKLYKLFLFHYCTKAFFSQHSEEEFANAISKTNHMHSRHEQAQKILTALNITDEKEDGWWMKEFMLRLNKESGRQSYVDQRSFTQVERPKFLKQVEELANATELTSVLLALALIKTQRSTNSHRRVKKIFDMMPDIAEEYFVYKGP